MGQIWNENLLRLFSQVDEYIDDRFESWRLWRRHLHANPELSWQETETTAFIRQQLGEMDIALNEGPQNQGGIVNLQSDDADERLIAIRGDIDAIPVTEQTGLDFRSNIDGVMHACGHDVHTTVVLGVCDSIQHLIKRNLLTAPLNFRALFQPAEEVAQGATEMIACGALEGVQRIVTMHVDSSREVGCVGFKDGVQTAACDEVHINFSGEGGHGARPYETSDPIFAASQFINSAYSTIPRMIDPRRAVVLSFCQISGGQTANVIPTNVTIKGTLRSFDKEARNTVLRQLKDLADSVTRSMGVQVDVEIGVGIPSVNNCVETNDLLKSAAESFLPEESISEVEPSLGGEDFACYQSETQGSLVRIGSARGKHGTAYLHSPHFDVDEEVIRVAVALFTRSILRWSDFQA